MEQLTVKQALDMIPAAEKAAYIEATERSPRLVEIESNPERWLAFLDYDAVAAARRIVDYWTVRVDLFGPRAFLPLTLTGDGALSEEDMAVFRTGSTMLLPRTAQQEPVLLYDPARLTTTSVTDTQKRMRCIFYILSAVSETDSSLVCLCLYNTRTRKATFDPKLISDCVSYFGQRQVIPVRIVEAHMVMIASGLGSVIPLTLQFLDVLGPDKPRKIVVYENKSVEEIQQEMKTHGFTLEGLPRVPFEGLFSFGCFRRWIDERIRKDSHQYLPKPPPEETPEEVEIRERRKAEAASARRKRARKKIEMVVLQTEVDRLKKQRRELQATEVELQKTLDDANLVVRLFGHTAAAEAASARPSGSDLFVLGNDQIPRASLEEARDSGSLTAKSSSTAIGASAAIEASCTKPHDPLPTITPQTLQAVLQATSLILQGQAQIAASAASVAGREAKSLHQDATSPSPSSVSARQTDPGFHLSPFTRPFEQAQPGNHDGTVARWQCALPPTTSTMADTGGSAASTIATAAAAPSAAQAAPIQQAQLMDPVALFQELFKVLAGARQS